MVFDTFSLLTIIDPSTQSFCCVGDLKSRERRCHNRIAKGNQDAARSIINTLHNLVHDESALQQQLRIVARLSLCKDSRIGHQRQRQDIVDKWSRIIADEIASQNRRHLDAARQQPVVVQHEERRSVQTVLLEQSGDAHEHASHQQETPLGDERERGGSTQVSGTSVRRGSSAPRSHNHQREREGNPPAAKATASQSSPANSSEDNQSECPICLEPYKTLLETPCHHKFCETCITQWLANSSTCPTDRSPLTLEDLRSPPSPSQSDEVTCSICFEGIEHPLETPCHHVFCGTCITQWLVDHPTCPLDRRRVTVMDLRQLDHDHPLGSDDRSDAVT